MATPYDAGLAQPNMQPAVTPPIGSQGSVLKPPPFNPATADPQVIKVAQAIRNVESQGNFNAVGDNGSSMGAYQWNNGNTPVPAGQTPINWQNAAKQYLGSASAPMTPENQNYVAYSQIKAYKDQGLTPASIDALWNGAKPDPMNQGQYIHNNSDRAAAFDSALTNIVNGTPQNNPQHPYEPPQDASFPYQNNQGVAESGYGLKTPGNIPSDITSMGKGLYQTGADLYTQLSQLPQAVQEAGSMGQLAINTLESVPESVYGALSIPVVGQGAKFILANLLSGVQDPLTGQVRGGFPAGGVNIGNTNISMNQSPEVMGQEALNTLGKNIQEHPVQSIAPLVMGGEGASGEGITGGKGDFVSKVASPVTAVTTKPLANLLKSWIGDSTNTVVTEAAARLGIPENQLPASARTTSTARGMVEASLAKLPGGGGIIDRAIAASEKLAAAGDKILVDAGGAQDISAAGQVIGQGLKSYVSQFKELASGLYGNFLRDVGDKLARTNNAVDTLNTILENKASIGDLEGNKFFEGRLAALEDTKKPPTFAVLKRMRTDIGTRVDKSFGDPFATANKAAMKQLYGALTDDMYATMKAQRGAKAKAIVKDYEIATGIYAAGVHMIKTAMVKKIQTFTAAGQFDRIIPTLLSKSTSLADIKSIMDMTGEEGRKQVQTAVLKDIFDKGVTPGVIKKALMNDGERLKAILTKDQLQGLVDIGKVSEGLAKLSKVTQGSQTAYIEQQIAGLGGIGIGALDLLAGNIMGAVHAWGLTLGAAATAKLFASELGQRLLVKGIEFRDAGLTLRSPSGSVAAYGNGRGNGETQNNAADGGGSGGGGGAGGSAVAPGGAQPRGGGTVGGEIQGRGQANPDTSGNMGGRNGIINSKQITDNYGTELQRNTGGGRQAGSLPPSGAETPPNDQGAVGGRGRKNGLNESLAQGTRGGIHNEHTFSRDEINAGLASGALPEMFEKIGKIPRANAEVISHALDRLPPSAMENFGGVNFFDSDSIAGSIQSSPDSWKLTLNRNATLNQIIETRRHELSGHLTYAYNEAYRNEVNPRVEKLIKDDPVAFDKLFAKNDPAYPAYTLEKQYKNYQYQAIKNNIATVLSALDDKFPNLSHFGTDIATQYEAQKVFSALPRTAEGYLRAADDAYAAIRGTIKKTFGDEGLKFSDGLMKNATRRAAVDEFLAHVIGYGGERALEASKFFDEGSIAHDLLTGARDTPATDGGAFKGFEIRRSLFGDLKEKISGAKGLSAEDIMQRYPDLNLKRDVTVTDLAGEKHAIQEGEALAPYEMKGNKVLLKDGGTYVVSKNQYLNVKNNSEVATAPKEFAPELKDLKDSFYGSDKKGNSERDAAHSSYQTQVPTSNKDYHAIVLTTDLPEGVPPFKNTSHFPDENPLAHMRAKTVTTDKYGKVYLTEEAQSDWNQAARKYGTLDMELAKNAVARLAEVTKQMDELEFKRGDLKTWWQDVYENKLTPHYKEMLKSTSDMAGNLERFLNENPEVKAKEAELQDITQKFDALKAERDQLRNIQNDESGKAPAHPLLNKWLPTILKRGLIEAVDRNSDYFAWTTGKQQIDRYGLAKKIDHVTWIPYEGGGRYLRLELDDSGSAYRIYIDKDGKITDSTQSFRSFVGKPLSSLLENKGLADEIMASPEGSNKTKMEIGGAWARRQYDEQMKNVVEDITGGKVEYIDVGAIPKGVSNVKEANSGEAITSKNAKVGQAVTYNDGSYRYVIDGITKDAHGGAQADLVREDYMWESKKLKVETVPQEVGSFKVRLLRPNGDMVNYSYVHVSDTTTITPAVEAKAKASAAAMRRTYTRDRNYRMKTVELANPEGVLQPALKLTPRIKALIKGEAAPMKKPVGLKL